MCFGCLVFGNMVMIDLATFSRSPSGFLRISFVPPPSPRLSELSQSAHYLVEIPRANSLRVRRTTESDLASDLASDLTSDSLSTWRLPIDLVSHSRLNESLTIDSTILIPTAFLDGSSHASCGHTWHSRSLPVTINGCRYEFCRKLIYRSRSGAASILIVRFPSHAISNFPVHRHRPRSIYLMIIFCDEVVIRHYIISFFHVPTHSFF